MELTFGIEEEFFVVGDNTLDLAPAVDETFLARASEMAGGGIGCELLQSQVETWTPVCHEHQEARDHLRRLRGSLKRAGQERGLRTIAAGTHPTGEWPQQLRSDKQRYDNVVSELRILAYRNLVCGLHVHVALPCNDVRIDVMRRATPFLPLLLALSCSSPFWRSMESGFASYRLTAYEELPRTGLPPAFARWSDYAAYTGALIDAGVMPDPSFVWWAIRPSHRYPTLELRIADACTSLADTLVIAALYRCLVRALAMDPRINAEISPIDRAFAKENKWRVQRWGLDAELIDPFHRGHHVSARVAVLELADRLGPHAQHLGCMDEVADVERILQGGNSSDRQLDIYRSRITRGGATHPEALTNVVDWLQAETVAGL